MHPARLAFVGLAAVPLLAGCAPDETVANTSTVYTDGEYTADGQYLAPSGQETLTVTLTLAHDTVTAVEATGHADDPSAQHYQEQFASGIADLVVGVDIDLLDVNRVAGSSLTSSGFHAAVEAIKEEARES